VLERLYLTGLDFPVFVQSVEVSARGWSLGLSFRGGSKDCRIAARIRLRKNG
jgi:hypothetical protein